MGFDLQGNALLMSSNTSLAAQASHSAVDDLLHS